ncbi:MAG TPA: bifunctional precorrin-2 dehydrogenase/sirohydrochlorin ferrochelatase [Ktedonobacteraceae bacterium]|nr:bifunctional precorrin-2 dehydrogenase/sirohydrochlorin ferrochelatase [Ktedonobacteraceae bacterium]
MPDYYPAMLDIRGRAAIVIGGDRVAAEKAAALAASGAHVHVQSLEFCEELLKLVEQKQVTLRRKAYEPGDLAGAFVVIAATNDPRLVQSIWAETQERGQLVNIVDLPEYCTFILPSILRRGQLTIAVSTEGASPGLAKRIRYSLEETFPPAYGSYVRLAALARTQLRRNGVSYERRDDFFRDFFASEVLHWLTLGNRAQAALFTAALLRDYGIDVPASVLEVDLEREEAHGHRDR